MSWVPNPQSKIFVAGHRGLVGSAIVRALERHGYRNIVCRSRADLDLTDQRSVRDFFAKERPDVVILAAAKVGGIGPNSIFPVEFLLENISIQSNVISFSAEYDAKKLVFLGSSCVYPKSSRSPITEDQFLTGPLEPTNEAYALAKAVGVRLCQSYFRQYQRNFISLMPTNVYGPGDRYDPENSHVIPAVLLKILTAKKRGESSVTLWGSGQPLREFIYSDDLADAVLVTLKDYNESEIINIGSGEEISISKLAEMICEACGYTGKIIWNAQKSDGIQRKFLDSTKIMKLGWKPKVALKEGLKSILAEAERKIP